MPQVYLKDKSGEVIEVPEGENSIGRGPLLKVSTHFVCGRIQIKRPNSLTVDSVLNLPQNRLLHKIYRCVTGIISNSKEKKVAVFTLYRQPLKP